MRNSRQKYYDSLFCEETDGVCQYAFGLLTDLGLCDDCHKIVIDQSRCKAKTKFILKNKLMEFRDVAVCGVHKNMLVNSTYMPKDWEIIASTEHRKKHLTRVMVAKDIMEIGD